MNAKYTKTNSVWSTLARILVFILALYLAYLILKPLLIIILGVGFWVFKVFVFLAVALLVIHLLTRIIFNIDLHHLFFGKSFRK